MDFLLWAVRSLHIFGVIVWFGGLIYQAVVTGGNGSLLPDATARRFFLSFQPFVWMSVWTILITGTALMLFSPRFIFFRYEDAWSVLLGLKQLTFLIMIVFAFGHARMFSRVNELLENKKADDQILPYHRQMLQFGRINVGLAIVAVLLSSGMT